MNINKETYIRKNPFDGQQIVVLMPDGNWYNTTYFNDNEWGVLENHEGDITEIEEYKNELLWKYPVEEDVDCEVFSFREC